MPTAPQPLPQDISSWLDGVDEGVFDCVPSQACCCETSVLPLSWSQETSHEGATLFA